MQKKSIHIIANGFLVMLSACVSVCFGKETLVPMYVVWFERCNIQLFFYRWFRVSALEQTRLSFFPLYKLYTCTHRVIGGKNKKKREKLIIEKNV